MCYIVFDIFLNVSQLYLTFLILFKKLYHAAESGDVALAHKGADVHYKDGDVSSIYSI